MSKSPVYVTFPCWCHSTTTIFNSGNPLLREYDAGNQIASAGPDYIWKIYEGTKKSTKVVRSYNVQLVDTGNYDQALELLL